MNQERIPKIDPKDLAATEVEIFDNPLFNNLAIFVQDPQNRTQYFFRKIWIKPDTIKVESGKEFPFFDLGMYDMGKFSQIPCPESQLPFALRDIAAGENTLGSSSSQEHRDSQAVVGIVRYIGQKRVSVDEIAFLAARKYYLAKMSYFE